MSPTWQSLLEFELKAAYFRVKRFASDCARPIRRWPLDGQASPGALLAEVSTPLRGAVTERDAAEARLIEGKIHNLGVALRRLDGARVPAGGTLSFWQQIGRATPRAGYVQGRELREGCIIPTIGGGLCQLSNALYGAALDAGCEILERHAHSQIVPGSLTERGRDATIFWNYVDLRFRSRRAFTIRAVLDDHRLVVRFLSEADAAVVHPLQIELEPGAVPAAQPSCMSCRQVDCVRHRVIHRKNSAPRSVFLLDAYWPEYDIFVAGRATERDLAYVPIDGVRYRLPRYAWTLSGFGGVKQAPIETLLRSLRSRRLATYGAARQRAMLRDAERVATRFSRALSSHVEHVVVMQNLLPYLWRSGALVGRTFDVLMTALPMRALHDVLDRAARLHPESTTLGDFRATDDLVECEREALAHARHLVTPHVGVARRCGERALSLPWAFPAVARESAAVPARVLFAGATLGRSGAYEMREAARRLGTPVVLVGERDAKSPSFWQGIDVTRVPDFRQGLGLASAVALPAFVEHQPRRLLHAISAGRPVIASDACGLTPGNGVTILPAGDADTLAVALHEMLSKRLEVRA
ncbi:MAG TPA: VanW family protein [Candidatus Cybelea sp.]|jgi:glycosyltransferase involved in cell wall biosynthesis|nr:VanW family protein [Candidatus Cybelea sp.]